MVLGRPDRSTRFAPPSWECVPWPQKLSLPGSPRRHRSPPAKPSLSLGRFGDFEKMDELELGMCQSLSSKLTKTISKKKNMWYTIYIYVYTHISIRWGKCIQIKKKHRNTVTKVQVAKSIWTQRSTRQRFRQRLDHTHLVWSLENCDSASPLWNRTTNKATWQRPQ